MNAVLQKSRDMAKDSIVILHSEIGSLRSQRKRWSLSPAHKPPVSEGGGPQVCRVCMYFFYALPVPPPSWFREEKPCLQCMLCTVNAAVWASSCSCSCLPSPWSPLMCTYCSGLLFPLLWKPFLPHLICSSHPK